MHSIRAAILGIIAISIITPLTSGDAAHAAIRCEGPYQLVRGQGKIATPYCEDGFLAAVARGYGMKVSGNAIRHNPHKKDDACRLAGHDIRVADICAGHRDESDGRR